MKNMNREQRERHEQGRLQGTLPFVFSSFLGIASRLQGSLPFLFAIFACFAVRIYWDLLGTLPLNSMNREQREGYERGETEPTNSRGFSVFRGIFPGTLPFSGKGSPLPLRA